MHQEAPACLRHLSVMHHLAPTPRLDASGRRPSLPASAVCPQWMDWTQLHFYSTPFLAGMSVHYPRGQL